MAARQDWQRIAEPTLRIAQAADLELNSPYATHGHGNIRSSPWNPIPT
jgi:hypothetical protein